MRQTIKPQYQETSRQDFLEWLQTNWRQGEHVAIIGPTGRGKTYLAVDVVNIRDYVVALAVKRNDDTIGMFKKKGYDVISKWPPDFHQHKVVLWIKPTSLSGNERGKQQMKVFTALNAIYKAGGWCLFVDDAGHVGGLLKLYEALGVLLSEGRSSYLSIVTGMVRPHSVVGRIPLEVLNQIRHAIIFKYTNMDEIKACAVVAGISYADMVYYMSELDTYPDGHSDFLYVGKDCLILVHNP